MTKKWTEQDKRAVMALGIAVGIISVASHAYVSDADLMISFSQIARRHPILERYEDMWPVDAYAFDRLPKKTIKVRTTHASNLRG